MKLEFANLAAIDITTACNFQCAHCYNNSGNTRQDSLSYEELKKTVAAILDFRPANLCFCGGEPLLYPRLLELMDLTAGKVANLNLVSNGWFITREKADELVSHGLSSIQISLDGAEAWQHDSLRGKAGAFERAEQAIANMRSAGIRQIMVSMLPDRLNFRSLPKYFSLCRQLQVDTIRVVPFIPAGRGLNIGRNLMLNTEEMFEFQRHLWELTAEYAGIITAEWDDPVRSARVVHEQIIKGRPPVIIVSSTGEVKTDFFTPVVLGNIRDRSLREILTSPITGEVQQKISRLLKEYHQLYDMEDVNEILS